MKEIPEAIRVELADKINSLNLSWTASSYLDNPKELNLAEVSSTTNNFNDGSAQFKETLSKA
jgi:hypothetical protein